MENNMYTLELLKELKTQNKRWFLAFIILMAVFTVVTVVGVGIRLKMEARIGELEKQVTEHCSVTQGYMETMLEYIEK